MNQLDFGEQLQVDGDSLGVLQPVITWVNGQVLKILPVTIQDDDVHPICLIKGTSGINNINRIGWVSLVTARVKSMVPAWLYFSPNKVSA